MTTLKQGDLIKDKHSFSSRVLEVCGTILHISSVFNHETFSFTSNEAKLKGDGYTWDTPAWEPSKGKTYWCIDNRGHVFNSIWNDDEFDHDRRDFLGIYETKELCDAVLLEIRRKLGK